MSKSVIVGRRTYVVSDSEYANIDWGQNADDVPMFETEDGGFVVVNWHKTPIAWAFGPDSGPGSYPGYDVVSEDGIDNHVSQATRDAIVAALQVPGSEDQILAFTTSGGELYHVATATVKDFALIAHTLVIPVP